MELIDQFILGKWEDIFPQLSEESFDFGYTDPPYGMNYISQIPGHKQWNKQGKSESKFYKPILGDDGNLDWALLAKGFYRILKNNSFLFLHGNVEDVLVRHARHFIDAGFVYKGTVAWNKKFAIGGDLYGAMKRSWEPILYFAKGKPKLNPVKVDRKGKIVEKKRIEEIGGDWEFMLSRAERVKFPTQKPLALARQVIRLCTKEGDLVCDPFAGSGTFPLAARLEKRHFFAVEADDTVYYKHRDRVLFA